MPLFPFLCVSIRVAFHVMVVGLGLWLGSDPALATEKGVRIPRTIIALYSSQQDETIEFGPIHNMAETPLNHLGLTLEYHDVDKGLPNLGGRTDVRGMLAWFPAGLRMRDPEHYLRWLSDAMDQGVRAVLMGAPGFLQDTDAHNTQIILINSMLRRLGLQFTDNWVEHTYDTTLTGKHQDMVEFERVYPAQRPGYMHMQAIGKDVQVHLASVKPGQSGASPLVITHPHGGYIAENYAYYSKLERDETLRKQWYINPFVFFRDAFATDDLPKPDTTTLAGRRIYYSHIDGDGWLNMTQIGDYRHKPVYSAEVIFERAIIPYPDLPVTVAPIAAELDEEWLGTAQSQDIARKIFALPQVEAGSHSYSHPFQWEFFAEYSKDKERPFLHLYPGGGWKESKLPSLLRGLGTDTHHTEAVGGERGYHLTNDYTVPRAYAMQPYSVEHEIKGSIETINRFTPDGKAVNLFMWSGNTSPYAAAVAATDEVGMCNINGGDSRFDQEYPSYGWVAPIGRNVGGYQQIYASNSNENTYTDLWSGKFHGFKYLIHTVENTESPIRLKPFNIYYHMYSGEKQASLNALLKNLDYARQQPLIPITASAYCTIARGFYTTDIQKVGPERWRVYERGALQTIRFDEAEARHVDFSYSQGVIGYRYHQGSLYVYLDAAHASPLIALHDESHPHTPSAFPYLIESRWQIYDLTHTPKETTFTAQGFGTGSMRWQVPADTAYLIYINGMVVDHVKKQQDTLEFTLEVDAVAPVTVTIRATQ